MALTGKFLADFSDFTAEVQKANTSLRFFQTTSEQATQALNRTAEAFSGKKTIQDATLAAEAIERLGGASKLTESEQAAVNRTVTEAIAKYRALGQEAPAELQALADATRRVEDTTKQLPRGIESIGGSLNRMAGLIGIGFSVGAVVNFGRHVFDTASQIHDLSESLGISAEAAQRYRFAAEQSGATMDDVARSINFMNRALAEPTNGTVDALKAAGLSFDQISRMNPEEAFNAITEAIRGIPDPTIQAKVATELFSRSALSLLPGIKEGFVGIGRQATVMSDDTINSLEAAQDAWGKLADRVTIVSGNLIAAAQNTASAVTSSWSHFVLFADTAIKQGIGAAVALTSAEDDAARAAGKVHDINLTLEGSTRKTKEQIEEEAAAHRKAAEQAAAHAKAIQSIRDSLSGEGAIKAAKDMLEALRGTIPVQQMTKDKQEEINKTMDQAIEVFRAQGKVAPQAMRDLWMATQPAIDVVNDLGESFDRVGASMKADIPEIHDWTIAWKEGIEGGINSFKETISIPTAQKGLFSTLFGDAKDFGSQLANAIQGAIQGGGNAVAAAAGALGSRIATNMADSLTKEGGKLFGSALGNIFAGALPIVGSLLGPLVGSLWGKIFGHAGRDAVKDFAASMGGFDELHRQLNDLGAEGERLWIKLTQGVGRNDPAAAQAAIQAVTDALEAQKQKAQEAGDAVTAEAGTVTDSHQQALDAIKKMDDEMQSLFDSIKDEAPEEVMGVVERQTRDRIAAIQKERDQAQEQLDKTVETAAEAAKKAGDIIDKTLAERQFVIRVKAQVEGLDGIRGGPTPELVGFQHGTQGRYLNFGSGTLAMLHGHEKITPISEAAWDEGGYMPVQVSVDGDVLIETIVRAAKRKGLAR